jgi:hypothetical protein
VLAQRTCKLCGETFEVGGKRGRQTSPHGRRAPPLVMGPVDASGRSRQDQLVYVGEGEGEGVGGQVMTKLMSLSRVTVVGPVYEVITLPALM